MSSYPLQVTLKTNDEGAIWLVADVPTQGRYTASMRLFQALTFSAAVMRLDDVHDGEWDEGETNEEGRVAWWENLNGVLAGVAGGTPDESLLQVVVRIMACDTLGEEAEGLEYISRYVTKSRQANLSVIVGDHTTPDRYFPGGNVLGDVIDRDNARLGEDAMHREGHTW